MKNLFLLGLVICYFLLATFLSINYLLVIDDLRYGQIMSSVNTASMIKIGKGESLVTDFEANIGKYKQDANDLIKNNSRAIASEAIRKYQEGKKK